MGLLNLIFKKDNFIGTIDLEVELDVIISEGVSTSSTITQNPVEQGADVSDHIIINPLSFAMSGIVSDTPVKFLGGLSSGLSLLSGETPSVKAWDKLLQLQASREPFTLVTNLKEYDNVVIETLSTTQDKDTSKMLNFSATMKEIILVGTQEISEVQFDEQDTADGMIATIDEGFKS